MKIIDKNTDFYDYIQNTIPDEGNLVFDRTDSYILTREELCSYIWVRGRGGNMKYYSKDKIPYKFLLLQVGNVFWLFLLGITKINSYARAEDYMIELITTWKNYDKPRKLTELSLLDFEYPITQKFKGDWYGLYFGDYDRDEVMKHKDILIKSIDTNDYKIVKHIDRHIITKDDGAKIEKHIPLFKACGISQIVDPLQIYLAFDEYFSLEKQATERIDAVGTTNDDKIRNHGFDTKKSFRNTK